MSEQQPDPPADDDQFDPATSHGSDLDPRTGTDEDEQPQAPTKPAPDRGCRPPTARRWSPVGVGSLVALGTLFSDTRQRVG